MKINIILLFTILTLQGCINPSTNNLETNPSVGTTTKGKKQGERKTYYTNGQIAKIENYLNDTLNGQFVYFDEKGKIKGKLFYRMGLKVDSSQMYFPNGKVNLEEWKDSSGKIQGLFKVYHVNGQLSQIGYMKDSYLDDTCKTYFDNGQLKTLEFYKDRKKEGAWQYFSKQGTIIRTEVYNNDILISSNK
jgi:antitoxin component YwqK of YwqJK toxin-antitoxin module